MKRNLKLFFIAMVCFMYLLNICTISNAKVAEKPGVGGKTSTSTTKTSTKSSTSTKATTSTSTYKGSTAGMPTNVPTYNNVYNSDGTKKTTTSTSTYKCSTAGMPTNVPTYNNVYNSDGTKKTSTNTSTYSGSTAGMPTNVPVYNTIYDSSGSKNGIINNKYYVNGSVVKNKKAYSIAGTYYNIDSSGKLTKTTGLVNNKYYVKGEMIKNKNAYNIGDIYYSVDKNGNLKKLNNQIVDNHYYNSSGKLVKNTKTVKVGNLYYDIDKNGKVTKIDKVLRDGKYYVDGKITYQKNKNGLMIEVGTNKAANAWLGNIRYREGKEYIYRDSDGVYKHSSGTNKGQPVTEHIGKCLYKNGNLVAKVESDGIFYEFKNNKITKTVYTGKIGNLLYNKGKKITQAGRTTFDGTVYIMKDEKIQGIEKNGLVYATNENGSKTKKLYTGATGKEYYENGKLGGTKIVDGVYYRNGKASNSKLLKSCENVKDIILQRNAHYPENMNYSLLNDKLDIKNHLYNEHYIVCATYVAAALYDAGYVSEQTINKSYYHSANAVGDMLQKAGWTVFELHKGDSLKKLKAEDVIVEPGVHIMVYAGNNEFYDQKTCVVGSDSVTQPTRSIEPNFWEKHAPGEQTSTLKVYRKA